MKGLGRNDNNGQRFVIISDSIINSSAFVHNLFFIICSSCQIRHTNFALFLPLFLGVIGMTEATDAKQIELACSENH